MKKIKRNQNLDQQTKKSQHIPIKLMKKINQLTKTRLQNQSLYWSQIKQFDEPTKNEETNIDEKEQMKKMELGILPTRKQNEMHSNEEK